MKKIYLCMGLAFFLMTAWISGNKVVDSLSEHTLRLHIVANSNSFYDQQMKLKVRDEVLKQIDDLLPRKTDKSSTTDILLLHQDLLLNSARRVLEENNCSESLMLTYGKENFPNKRYLNLSFPSGEYDSFKLIIGEGKGENWWSVLYPSLCIPAIEEIDEEKMVSLQNELSKEELEFICSEQNQVLFRLKLIDYYDIVKEKIKKIGSRL